MNDKPAPDEKDSQLAAELTPTQLDLLKLEYGRAADRYENIYKAIWQNFQYVVVAAAAVASLGFGKAKVVYVLFAALTPIVFWLLATFVPLNHYGEQARTRLKQLEAAFNARYFQDGDPTGLDAARPQMRHYQSFRDRLDPPQWRVATVVLAFGALAMLAWILALVGAINCAAFGATCLTSVPKSAGASVGARVTTDSVPPLSPATDAPGAGHEAALVRPATQLPTPQHGRPSVTPAEAASSSRPTVQRL